MVERLLDRLLDGMTDGYEVLGPVGFIAAAGCFVLLIALVARVLP